MRDRFLKTGLDPSTPDWDFARYQASDVVINLGTNDKGHNVSSAQFQSAYVTLLQRIRVKYPNATIHAMETFKKRYVNETKAAVTARGNAGDSKVRYVSPKAGSPRPTPRTAPIPATRDIGRSRPGSPLSSGESPSRRRKGIAMPIRSPIRRGAARGWAWKAGAGALAFVLAVPLTATNVAGTASASGSVATAANRFRTVTDFDPGWLFNYGDASGAGAASYADGGWRKLSVPHDWSIEGGNPPANPFSQSAPSTGRGGYLPSGIGWYRKHFSLAGVPATRKVYVEFDGVMANASVYVNGTLIGTHPYGYTSFRYDITAAVKFGGADNVIAVKTDTSQQPASRYYTGAGIYRDVRLIATDPVHVDQWATYVTTPNATSAAATVHAETTVVNNGGAAASVSVQGVLSDPGGAALPAVTTAAKTIAAGALGHLRATTCR